jgi:hypothetical protein
LITEQLISRDELLEAVHEASVRLIEADKALRHYRLDGSLENPSKLNQLRRALADSEQSLRDAQAQLVLGGPFYY